MKLVLMKIKHIIDVITISIIGCGHYSEVSNCIIAQRRDVKEYISKF